MDIQIKCCICESIKDIVVWEAQPWCKGCKIKEEGAQKDIVDTADERVNEMNMNTLERQIHVDTTIQVTSDVFNAKTVAIIELKEAIDNDDSIENKQYELAKRLKDRFTHLKEVIFERTQENLNDSSEQRSIQSYLNNLANNLREKERDELRLKDLTYKPLAPSKPAKPRKPKAPKFNKADVKLYAAQIGVDEFTLQMICVSKGLQPKEAAEELKKMVAVATSSANGDN